MGTYKNIFTTTFDIAVRPKLYFFKTGIKTTKRGKGICSCFFLLHLSVVDNLQEGRETLLPPPVHSRWGQQLWAFTHTAIWAKASLRLSSPADMRTTLSSSKILQFLLFPVLATCESSALPPAPYTQTPPDSYWFCDLHQTPWVWQQFQGGQHRNKAPSPQLQKNILTAKLSKGITLKKTNKPKRQSHDRCNDGKMRPVPPLAQGCLILKEDKTPVSWLSSWDLAHICGGGMKLENPRTKSACFNHCWQMQVASAVWEQWVRFFPAAFKYFSFLFTLYRKWCLLL